MADGAPRPRGLRPLGSAQGGAAGRDAEAEARLSHAWSLVVGPALATRTRLLRVRRGTLVVGAWDLSSVEALRRAAQAAWPEVRRRLRLTLGLDLQGLSVEPCDPPQAATPPREGARTLERLLETLRRPPSSKP